MKRGFTIVELLIVIVVVAILAAVSIIGYNGIQTRARNAQTAAVVQAYRKAFAQYAIENQAYPISVNSCLGDDYPDSGVFTTVNNRKCFRSTSAAGTINATLNNALKPYMGNKIVTPNNTIFGDGSNPWATRGAVYMGNQTSFTIDGASNPWVLVYTIEGQNACPVGPVLNLASWPNLTSAPPATGYSQLLSGGTVGVECWIALPDPSKV